MTNMNSKQEIYFSFHLFHLLLFVQHVLNIFAVYGETFAGYYGTQGSYDYWTHCFASCTLCFNYHRSDCHHLVDMFPMLQHMLHIK